MRGCLGLTFKQGSNGGMIPLPHGRPRWSYVLWCVVRYGYTDVWFEEEPFERLLVGRLKEVIREEMMMTPTLKHSNGDMVSGELQDGLIDGENENKESKQIDEEMRQKDVDKDI